VKQGEQVGAGQPLGLVGLSGETEFPHLHFGVARDSATVDPFGGEAGTECRRAAPMLWDEATRAALPYAPGVIFNFGVAPRMPEVVEVRDGSCGAGRVPRDAPALVVWAEVFGTTAGEVLLFTVEAPDGRRFLEQRFVIERSQARAFRAYGRKRGAEPWSSGT